MQILLPARNLQNQISLMELFVQKILSVNQETVTISVVWLEKLAVLIAITALKVMIAEMILIVWNKLLKIELVENLALLMISVLQVIVITTYVVLHEKLVVVQIVIVPQVMNAGVILIAQLNL